VSRSLRVVAYAINGRGMGHLSRQLAVLRWMRRFAAALDVRLEPWVLTSSEADTLARREGVPALKMPSKAMLRDAGVEPHSALAILRSWVLNAVVGLRPDLLVVDTFPGGSFGELVPCLELAKHRALVSRRVRPEYADADPFRSLLPLYDTVVEPEEGGSPILLREREELVPRDDARRRLGVPTDHQAIYVSVGGGGDDAASSLLPRCVAALQRTGRHIVVGAGPLYDGPEIRGPGITWLDRYVPLELFAGLDGAVCAAGYNSFHELMFAGVPSVFLPRPRIADDQQHRAQGAVDVGAAALAEGPDASAEALQTLLGDWDGGPSKQAAAARAAAQALVPENGARDAALQILGCVLPADDLARAERLLAPPVLSLMARAEGRDGLDGPRRVLDLLKLLDGPGDPLVRLNEWLALNEAHGAPPELCVRLLQQLRRKFRGASGDELLQAWRRLVPAWAAFDDWMGAVSLMRAVPSQRGLSLAVFVDGLLAWLAHVDELFDAVRDFSRLEGAGDRPVDEVLALLAAQAQA